MTMGLKVACSRLLLVQNEQVVLTHGIDVSGRLSSCLGAILLDDNGPFPPTYVAGVRLFEPLAKFNELVQDSTPGWRMRITNRRRHAYFGDGKVKVSGRFFVDYMCIDRKLTKSKRSPRRRIEVINLDLLFSEPPKYAEDQLEAALAILEMCENRGVEYRSTKGAIGSAMLKVSPYWDRDRRAAPKFINDEARKYLPGNFYSVSQRVKSEHVDGSKLGYKFTIPQCYYIDQTSSHHSIVSQIRLPRPDSVHARGNYAEQKRWCTPDSPSGQALMDGTHVGVLLCKVHISQIGPGKEHLYPQWALKRGTRYVWIWTPELRLLQDDHRIQLEHFCGGFTGTSYDAVLPEYSEWAMREIKLGNQDRAKHKKGPLLAAYGMLAFNSDNRQPIYRYWGGENKKMKVEIPLAGLVGESRVRIPSDVELSTVNVVARGLIEAETRTRSIEYARELDAQGFHIAQIYADGILVATDALPFVREGWRVSHTLTHVHIPRPNAIISDELVKLPGVSGGQEDREWERSRDRARVIVEHMVEH
jgi:hypothetical protein